MHDFTLGHMITPISSHDPLFWLHHAGLDRGWTVWQQLCGRGGDATRRCGTAASPLGYRPLPPDPKLWVQSEDPRWALRHADARTPDHGVRRLWTPRLRGRGRAAAHLVRVSHASLLG